MPKSKQRKKHKVKVQQYHQRVAKERNEVEKMEKVFMSRILEHNENARKEVIIERLYTTRPEFAVEQNGTFVVNEELIEEQNDMLVWKDTGNPILAGLEALEYIPIYKIPVVNLILQKFYLHHQAKQAAGEVIVEEASYEEVEPVTQTADVTEATYTEL